MCIFSPIDFKIFFHCLGFGFALLVPFGVEYLFILRICIFPFLKITSHSFYSMLLKLFSGFFSASFTICACSVALVMSPASLALPHIP